VRAATAYQLFRRKFFSAHTLLLLHHRTRTPGKAKLIEYVENVDKWSVGVGGEMRRNPYLRAGFVGYLIILHIWVFGIVVWHAHSFEAEHGDFGSYRHLDQLHGHPKGYKGD